MVLQILNRKTLIMVLINNNKVFFYLVQTSIKRDFYSLSQKKFERFNSMKERFNDINSHHICLTIVEGSWPVKFTLIHSYEYVWLNIQS